MEKVPGLGLEFNRTTGEVRELEETDERTD
jgi:hypothetical protein